jgi:hypothetical protein
VDFEQDERRMSAEHFDDEMESLTEEIARYDWRASDIWCDRRLGQLYLHSDATSMPFLGDPRDAMITKALLVLFVATASARAGLEGLRLAADNSPVFDASGFWFVPQRAPDPEGE